MDISEFNDLTSEEVEALIGRVKKQQEQDMNSDVQRHAAVTHNALVKEDEKQDADMIIVLSSELMCNIMQEYYSRIMPRMNVKVLDVAPTSNGLMQFSLAITDVKP